MISENQADDLLKAYEDMISATDKSPNNNDMYWAGAISAMKKVLEIK